MLILHSYVSRVFNTSVKFLRSPIFPNAKKSYFFPCKKLLLHIIWEITTERLFSPNEIRDSMQVLGLLNLRTLKSQISRVNYFFIPQIQWFLYPQLIHHFILCEHKMFSQGVQLTCSHNIPVTSFESHSLGLNTTVSVSRYLKVSHSREKLLGSTEQLDSWEGKQRGCCELPKCK